VTDIFPALCKKKLAFLRHCDIYQVRNPLAQHCLQNNIQIESEFHLDGEQSVAFDRNDIAVFHFTLYAVTPAYQIVLYRRVKVSFKDMIIFTHIDLALSIPPALAACPLTSPEIHTSMISKHP